MAPKKKKQNDDYWETQFEQDQTLIASPDANPINDESESTKKKEKKNSSASDLQTTFPKHSEKVAEMNEPIDTSEEVPTTTSLKSKKQKEKEKKERQKLEKKAAKQSEQPQSLKKDSLASNHAKEESNQEDIHEKLSNLAIKEEHEMDECEETDAAAASSSGKSNKKKKKKAAATAAPPAAVNSKLAALQAMVAARKAAEEEALLFQKQEEERIAREEAEAAAEAARIAEEKRKKKERQLAKKEELRKAGKLLTRGEKERANLNKLRLGQMLSSGGVVMNAGNAEENPQQKRVVYEHKKKFTKQPKEEKDMQKLSDALVDAKSESNENQLENNTNPKQEEAVKDSWEDEEEEEVEAMEKIQESVLIKKPLIQNNEEEDDENEILEGNPQKSGKKTPARERPPELRSPICCILGHVDTGKTKLLDKIRQTNVQEGEAGGITQQIGATYFPADILKQKTAILKETSGLDIKIPGLLIIDTPGHESFTNLRSRGSSLCNIAILVVDIMHGLEPQTLESIELLRSRKTPFLVALNKIDRLYDWKPIANNSFEDSFKKQSPAARGEFESRLDQTKLAFAQNSLNAEIYTRNKDIRKVVSLVPTSAISGEGIPDLLTLITSLTQEMMSKSLMYVSKLQATILEVKVIEGLGTTIDVILSNGYLKEGDRIAVCGMNGPIVTNIRALLTPQPMRELRIKGSYVHHKRVKAALGVKISAPDLDKAIAGSNLLVIEPGDDEEAVKNAVQADLNEMLGAVDKTSLGVCVQSSTLGSLEALLSFLKSSNIPVNQVNIGPIHKKDVVMASAILERAKEFAVILAFDVKIDKEVQDFAEEMDVKIFKADIIYHLFDQFTAYMKDIRENRKKEMAPAAVFPCILKIVSGCVFNKRDPIILGVDVIEGTLRKGTPICVPAADGITLGRVTSIELNHKPLEIAKKNGPSVAVKIERAPHEPCRMLGRHFTEKDELVSKISRASIDILKNSFRDEVSKEEWQLIIKLKKLLKID